MFCENNDHPELQDRDLQNEKLKALESQQYLHPRPGLHRRDLLAILCFTVGTLSTFAAVCSLITPTPDVRQNLTKVLVFGAISIATMPIGAIALGGIRRYNLEEEEDSYSE